MKKLIIPFVLLIIYQNNFAQNSEDCKKIVELTIEAVNSKSSTILEPHLANNFSIAGQEGQIAKLVLKQLFTQLDDKITNYEATASKINGDQLTLSYSIDYENLGNKAATFVFNENNQLKKLTLFKMEVKTMDEQKIENNTNNVTTIPFKMLGNLIAVEVTLNGETKTFILDSGAPGLILNSAYMQKNENEKRLSSSTNGAVGKISELDICTISSFDFAGIQLHQQKAVTINLSHFEKIFDTEIHGLIGYNIIKDYDVLFDYQKKEITLIQPEYFERFKNEVLTNKNLTIVPFEQEGHISIVKAKIGEKEYSFGIDCGAESNLMDDDLYTQLQSNHALKKTTTTTLRGASKNTKEITSCKTKETLIGGKYFKNMRTVFNDMSHLNESYKVKTDGLIGYEVLAQQPTLISYNRKEMIFID